MTITDERRLDSLSAERHQQILLDLKALSKKLLAWYQCNARELPWRKLWKRHQDPYHVWLSEVMLQQTLIKTVVPKYQSFLERYPQLRSLAHAQDEEVRLAVRGLGYYRRFSLFLKGARQILEASSARACIQWPMTYSEWKAVPGVGDYTAAAVSSIAFSQAEVVVDGNVERVFCRLLDIRLPPNLPKLKRLFKKIGNRLISQEFPGDFNQGLMELGQRLCTPSKPNCPSCPLQSLCLSHRLGTSHLAPAAKKLKAMVDCDLNLVVFHHENRIGLCRRPDKARFLKNTSGFLTLFKAAAGGFQGDGFRCDLRNFDEVKELGFVNHNITNHRLRVGVMLGNGCHVPKDLDLEWRSPQEVEASLVANLDRKAWVYLQKRLPWQFQGQ